MASATRLSAPHRLRSLRTVPPRKMTAAALTSTISGTMAGNMSRSTLLKMSFIVGNHLVACGWVDRRRVHRHKAGSRPRKGIRLHPGLNNIGHHIDVALAGIEDRLRINPQEETECHNRCQRRQLA